MIETYEEVLINVAAGTYIENITIDKRSVSLVGTGEDTIIDGGGGSLDVITINGIQNVAIEGFTIQNGNKGIYGKRGSAIEVSDTTVQDCSNNGIQVDENSTLQISDCTVLRSGNNGIGVYDSSSATFSGIIASSENGRVGLGIGTTSSAVFFKATLTTSNNGWRGINISLSSSLFCLDSSLTSKSNSNHGVAVHGGSSIYFSGTSNLLSETNTTWGLSAVGASFIWTDANTNLTMLNNERGFLVLGSSYAEITGSLLVEDSGKQGFYVRNNSGAVIGGFTTVRGTKGNDPITGDGIGILIDDASSVNAWGGSLIVENNQLAGIWVLRGSGFETGSNFSAQILNNGGGIAIQQRSNGRLRSGTVIQRNISDGIIVVDNSELFTTDVLVENNNGRGVYADDGSSAGCSNSTITGNAGGDVILSFGSRASLYGGSIGTISCDGTELIRGDYACTP